MYLILLPTFSFLLSSLSHLYFFLHLCLCEESFIKEIFKCTHIHMKSHWLTVSPISSEAALKKTAMISQTVMHVTGLLYCFLSLVWSTCFLLDTVRLKKLVLLALSSCFSGEYKVLVDQVQTSGCLREGEKKPSWRATFLCDFVTFCCAKKKLFCFTVLNSQKKIRNTKWPSGPLALQTQFIKSPPPCCL